MKLVADLIKRGRLESPQIKKAFQKVPRINFMAPEYKDMASVDNAFPIGHGQTISQPSTVAFMLEKLQPQKEDKILDIGSGSGWTTALLAEIVGKKGKVYAVEIVPEVYEFGKKNVERLGYKNVEFLCQDASGGLPEKAPFDRILASAAATKIPRILRNQLKLGGRLVIPVSDMVTLVKRVQKNKFDREDFPFFAFVPMQGKYGSNYY